MYQPISCEWVDIKELTGASALRQALVDEEFLTTQEFWALVALVAVTWATAHVIRQILNLVQFRR